MSDAPNDDVGLNGLTVLPPNPVGCGRSDDIDGVVPFDPPALAAEKPEDSEPDKVEVDVVWFESCEKADPVPGFVLELLGVAGEFRAPGCPEPVAKEEAILDTWLCGACICHGLFPCAGGVLLGASGAVKLNEGVDWCCDVVCPGKPF